MHNADRTGRPTIKPGVASTALGCRGKTDGKGKHKKHKTEEKVFQDVGVIAHEHCSKFQAVDVFAMCRKYHRAGTKQGWRSGVAAVNAVLEMKSGNQSQGRMVAILND